MAKKTSEKTPSSRTAPGAPAIDIGLSDGDRRRIAEGLSRFLADGEHLRNNARDHLAFSKRSGELFAGFDVGGAFFEYNTLHTMFETQYNEQWTALDEIAERIRALGFNAPGSYGEFARLSSIAEEPLGDTADWREMVRQLTVGNEAVCRTARKVLKGADDAGDDPSVDLLTQRLQTHEKYAWMLRSLLQ